VAQSAANRISAKLWVIRPTTRGSSIPVKSLQAEGTMTHASDMREQTLLSYAGSSAAVRLASISARQAFWCEVPGMNPRPVDVAKVSAVLEALLKGGGKPVCIADLQTGEVQPVSPELAASPSGLLPMFLAAGDTVWREATGRRLAITQVPDPEALLGLRTDAIAPGPVAPVMLSMMEAIAQAERPDMLLVNDMNRNWKLATERMRRAKPLAASPSNVPRATSSDMRP